MKKSHLLGAIWPIEKITRKFEIPLLRIKSSRASSVWLLLALLLSPCAQAAPAYLMTFTNSPFTDNNANFDLTIQAALQGAILSFVNPDPATFSLALSEGDSVMVTQSGFATTEPDGFPATSDDISIFVFDHIVDVPGTPNCSPCNEVLFSTSSRLRAVGIDAYTIGSIGANFPGFAIVNVDGTGPFDQTADSIFFTNVVDTVLGNQQNGQDTGTFGGPLSTDVDIHLFSDDPASIIDGSTAFSIALDGVATTFASEAEFVNSFTLQVGAVVPLPPAVWFFVSGLMGIIGIARRKKAA